MSKFEEFLWGCAYAVITVCLCSEVVKSVFLD